MELQRREDCNDNCDYCELLAWTCLAICLVLLSVRDNLDTRLGVWYHDSGEAHRIGAIGERATRAVADSEFRAGDESDRGWCT